MEGSVLPEKAFEVAPQGEDGGFPWWVTGSDSMLPMQGAQVQSLIRELDPTIKSLYATAKTDSACHN